MLILDFESEVVYQLIFKVNAHRRIFLKRANFEKIILLCSLGQAYTKITKNVNFEILANVLPPFLKQKKLRTW